LNGLHVLHKCDNRRCINPDHLFLGTVADNSKDKITKGRQCKGEQQTNSVLTNEQVVAIRRIYADGETSQPQLATQFGVCKGTIARIVQNKGWKHLLPTS
jgi:DNA-binding transcriptional regulator YiaG